jgi:hypothetical protein
VRTSKKPQLIRAELRVLASAGLLVFKGPQSTANGFRGRSEWSKSMAAWE